MVRFSLSWSREDPEERAPCRSRRALAPCSSLPLVCSFLGSVAEWSLKLFGAIPRHPPLLCELMGCLVIAGCDRYAQSFELKMAGREHLSHAFVALLFDPCVQLVQGTHLVFRHRAGMGEHERGDKMGLHLTQVGFCDNGLLA